MLAICFVVFGVFVLFFQRPKVTNVFSGSQAFFEGSFCSTVASFLPCFFSALKVRTFFQGAKFFLKGFFL